MCDDRPRVSSFNLSFSQRNRFNCFNYQGNGGGAVIGARSLVSQNHVTRIFKKKIRRESFYHFYENYHFAENIVST